MNAWQVCLITALFVGCSSPKAAREAVADAAADAIDADAAVAPADAEPSDAADAADVAKDATEIAACVPTPEVCDGIDNDCDGATDEDFMAQSPQGPVPIGSPCGTGVVICISPEAAGCSVTPDDGPQAYDPSAVLAPADAKVSPLTATGSFVDISSSLPFSALAVDAGQPTSVPDGSSPLVLDIDGDGDLDVVWLDGINAARLWTQTAPWQFTDTLLYPSDGSLMSAAALPASTPGATVTLALGGQKLVLLEKNASGQFVDVAAERGLVKPIGTAQIEHLLPADVNGDGRLDLVAGVFSSAPLLPSLYVWLDRGDGHFIESAQALGFNLHGSVWSDFFTDFDDDGVPDLMMLTESCDPDPGVALFQQKSGIYAPQPLPPLFTAPGQANGSPMGATVADVNGDGVLDYFLSEIELRDYVSNGGDPTTLNPSDPLLKSALSNQFLLSQASGPRKLAGMQAGLWAPLSTKGKPMTAWTPIWDDLDHDGHLDLLLSHACEYFAWTNGQGGSMRPVLFRNDGTQHFSDVSATFGLPAQHDGRAMLVADLDGDGDDDLLIGGHGVAPAVLRNDIVHGGADLRVQLVGQASNPWGLLARLKLQTNLRTLVMEHNVQAVPATMAMPLSHFALQPGEVPQSLTVQWPSGWTSQQVVSKLGVLQVTEPQLFSLSTRWSQDGTLPVVVQATQFAADGQTAAKASCSIELADGAKGAWQGPIACAGATCTRTWVGTAATHNGADAIVIGCGGQTWAVRPRIGY